MNRLIHLPPRALKIALIGVPLLLYALYASLFAANRYVSEAVVSVRQDSGDASAIPGAALLLAGVSTPSQTDTLYLKEFAHSQDLIVKLDAELGLRKHYSSIVRDLPFRLASDASLEEFVSYFRNRVEVLFDDRSSLLTVRVQAFDPAFAQAVARGILQESERFVNESSHRMARERLRFAESEAERATERVEKAQSDLLAFQNKHRLLDPTALAQASGALTAELEATRSRLEAELNGLRRFLNDDAYQVKALRSNIEALGQQIEAERRRATAGGRRGVQLNQLALQFQSLQLQAEFARDAYKLALSAVENARIESTRKLKSLIVVESPSKPETAEYPRVAYNMATLLAVCLLLYAIARLVLATIREHQD
jgi:capsular polysaccharide transport system permease protein